jgi:outer membrane protein assembly factor BamB
MRRSIVAAVAVAVLLIIAGSIYIVGPALLNGNSGSSTISSSTTSLSAGLSTSSQGASSTEDWTTYHADNARTGYLSVSNFTSVTKGWTSPALDGSIYAEPLIFRGDVFVATENNSVYALDGKTGSPLWQRNLGPPVEANTLPCGDIDPVTGITGTPVIDPSTGVLYVVTFSEMHHTMWALNVTTGSVVFQRAADPPGFNDSTQQQRTALTLANGVVYFGYGGLAGDCDVYTGWVVGLAENGTGSMLYYRLPSENGGGIWAPSGATVDQSGNVYFGSGNTASTTTYDFGEAILKLSPKLSEEQYFAPTNWAIMNQDDADIDSVGPAIVGPNLIFQIGKPGVGYLLNSSDLGGIGGQIFDSSVCDEAFGGTAFSSPNIFVPCINGLFVLRVANDTFSTALVVGGFDAGPPIVTDGVVWTVDTNTGTLYGLSASDGHQDYTFSLGAVERFISPSAGDGQLFVPATNVVESFVLG